MSTRMHFYQGVECVLMQEKNVVPCPLSQLRKRELNYLTSYLKLPIVEHESTIFLEVQVTSRRITRIYRTSSLRWS